MVEGNSLDDCFVELTCPTNGVEGVLCCQSMWLNLCKGDRFPDRCSRWRCILDLPKTKVFDQKMTTYPLSTAAENHNLLLCNTRHTSRCLCELKYFTTEGKILVQHDATRRHHHGTKQKRPKRTTHFVQTLSKK